MKLMTCLFIHVLYCTVLCLGVTYMYLAGDSFYQSCLEITYFWLTPSCTPSSSRWWTMPSYCTLLSSPRVMYTLSPFRTDGRRSANPGTCAQDHKILNLNLRFNDTDWTMLSISNSRCVHELYMLLWLDYNVLCRFLWYTLVLLLNLMLWTCQCTCVLHCSLDSYFVTGA